MVFTPPAWVPKLPFDPPDSITVAEFWGSEKYGRLPFDKARNPFTCGITGKTYKNGEVRKRYELLARALSKYLDLGPNEGTPWDKVIAIYSFNSIDYLTAIWAVHRVGGIVTPANAAYSAAELVHQLVSSSTKVLITCTALLDTASKAAEETGIPKDKIFIMDVAMGPETPTGAFKTLDDLIIEGQSLTELEPLSWTAGQGTRQVALLSYSSGTSGLPKAVMVSHRSIIANIMQIRWHESVGREEKRVVTQRSLGLLPLSHMYGLVVVAHTGAYRGDEILILPRYELHTLLESIQRFKINFLYLVPPIIIQLVKNQAVCKKYDFSSVRFVYTGAAPLGREVHENLERAFPGLKAGQAYGMTETSTLVLGSTENDLMIGSSGPLLTGCKARIVGEDGKEVNESYKEGELYIQSPSLALGYLNNEKATSETFIHDEQGRWIRTGDMAVVWTSPRGHQHFAIVDRLKELIKVKAHQVAPAELEAHLLTHPAVADCTVIPVPDDGAGEVPKAFVVRSATASAAASDEELASDIRKYVEEHKARYKWLKGGIEFTNVIPKSPSGKILRRLVRNRERDARKARGAKL